MLRSDLSQLRRADRLEAVYLRGSESGAIGSNKEAPTSGQDILPFPQPGNAADYGPDLVLSHQPPVLSA